MASHPAKRKRTEERQEKLRQYGVDLPDIPGLPIQVVPLHVHALKKASKLFRTDGATRIIYPFLRDENDASSESHAGLISNQLTGRVRAGGARDSNTKDGNASHFLDNIFDRMDQQVEPQNQQRKISNQQSELNGAIESWLNSIHRMYQDQGRRKTEDRNDYVVPLAAFRHVWSMVLKHKRVKARRAALHLGAHLLLKSSDCRRWLLDEETNLSDLIECLSRASDDQDEWMLFQQESSLILNRLMELGYHELYPTLTVGIQRLQQVCPYLQHGASESGSDMFTWRRARDEAILHYQDEEKRVRKLIKRAHACLDILVPRLERDHRNVDNSGKGDEDSSVDWEDGWQDEDNEDTQHSLHPDKETPFESNETTVERTLEAIRMTSTIQSGGIVIDFGSGQPAVGPKIELIDAASVEARARFERCVTILSRVHMPRLSIWIEGLIQADSLMVSQKGKGEYAVSLVSMPQQLSKVRADAVQCLLDVKQNVASILASSKKLGISNDEDSTVPKRISDSKRPATGANASRPIPRLPSQMTQRTVSKKAPRCRIHIKYRK